MTSFSLQLEASVRRVITVRASTLLANRLQDFLASIPHQVSPEQLVSIAEAIDWAGQFPVYFVETGDAGWPTFILQASIVDAATVEVLALHSNGQLHYGFRPGTVRTVLSDIQGGQRVLFLSHRDICPHGAYRKPPLFSLAPITRDSVPPQIVDHILDALGAFITTERWKHSADLNAQKITSYIVTPAETEIRANAWALMRRHLLPEIANLMEGLQTAHPDIYNWLAQRDKKLATMRLAFARTAPNMIGLMMDDACATMNGDDLIGYLNTTLGSPSSPAFWYMARAKAVDIRFNSGLWPTKRGPKGETAARVQPHRPRRAQMRATARVLSAIDPTWFPKSHSEDCDLTACAYQLVKVARTFEMDLGHLIKGIGIPDRQPQTRWRDLRARVNGALLCQGDATPISEWFMTAFYMPLLRPMLPTYDFDVYTDLMNTFMRTVPFWRILDKVTAFNHFDNRSRIASKLLEITGSPILPGTWAVPTPILVHSGSQGRSLVVPVAEREMLHLLARVMGNCLDGYLVMVARGDTNLTLVLDLAKLEATVGPLPETQDDRRHYVYGALRGNNPDLLDPVVVEYRPVGSRTTVHLAEGVRRRRVMGPREAEAIRWYEQVLLKNRNAKRVCDQRQAAQEPFKTIFELMERADPGSMPLLGPDAAPMREAVYMTVRMLSPTKEGRNARSVMHWMKIYKLDYIVLAACVAYRKSTQGQRLRP